MFNCMNLKVNFSANTVKMILNYIFLSQYIPDVFYDFTRIYLAQIGSCLEANFALFLCFLLYTFKAIHL